MSHHFPEHDPRSRLEEEGIPDLQAGTPEQQWAVDPQEAPVPGDEPLAVDEYGTTAEEQAEGESLDRRLSREEPDESAELGPEAAESGAEADEPGADGGEDRVTSEGGLGVGADLDTGYEAGPGADATSPAQPEEPSGEVWEPPRRAGRLVAPDEGAHPDTEPDEVAEEAGPDAGGYSAEESAMRVEPEDVEPEDVEPEDWEPGDEEDPDSGSGRAQADDGGYLPGGGTGRPY